MGGEGEEEYEGDTGEEAFELEVRVEDSASTVKTADMGVSVSPSHPICEGGTGSD